MSWLSDRNQVGEFTPPGPLQPIRDFRPRIVALPSAKGANHFSKTRLLRPKSHESAVALPDDAGLTRNETTRNRKRRLPEKPNMDASSSPDIAT
jgi:hypothetical protein